jgi:hypothetical protein
MDLPFSRPEFFAVFARFNGAIWPLQWTAAIAGVAAVYLLFFGGERANRMVAAIAAALWAFTGIAYHWFYFSDINPAAWIFGSLFVVEAIILAWEGGVRGRIRFRLERSSNSALSLLLLAYALVVYPLIGLLVTHPYPQTPLFGVTPCPTAIFTIGLLMVIQHPKRWLIAAIPLAWSFIGGIAAVALSVPQDWGLPLSGLLLIGVYATRTGSEN